MAVVRSWLPQRSVTTVRDALAAVCPELAHQPIRLHEWVSIDAPAWCRGSASVGEEWVVKFAWSEPAAAKLVYEIRVLRALAGWRGAPPVPSVYASSEDPVLLVCRFVTGVPLTFEAAAALTPDEQRRISASLARTLAAFHAPATHAAATAAGIELEPPEPQATTDGIRERLVPHIGSAQRSDVNRWCDWTDSVLATGAPPVLVHGDFHGYNLVVDDCEVRVALDLEEAALGDREYDFRYLPGHAPTVGLYVATAAAYQEVTGLEIDTERVMAWHVRTLLGDALWRTEAGVELPGGGTAAEWVDQLAARFAQLGITV